jgi:hypothetical protein
MVARAVVGIPTLLCLWISEIIGSLPGRCAVTVLELLTGTLLTGTLLTGTLLTGTLLTGTLLTGYGSISQAILAVPCRRHWTSYYWMVRKGKFDWKVMVHALCRIVKREFPSERCVVVGDDTLIPRVSEAAPGAATQYDHAGKPNRPDYILAQTVVSLSAVIGNSWGSWSVPLMSNLAVRTGNHGKLEPMRAMLEEVSASRAIAYEKSGRWFTAEEPLLRAKERTDAGSSAFRHPRSELIAPLPQEAAPAFNNRKLHMRLPWPRGGPDLTWRARISNLTIR